MADPKMDIIYRWAEQMGHPPAVPSSMKEPRNIAKFVDFIDRDIFANARFWQYGASEIQNFLRGSTKDQRSP
jgi:hypothetical protein